MPAMPAKTSAILGLAAVLVFVAAANAGPGDRPAPASQGIARLERQLAKPVTLEFPGTSFENVIDFLIDLSNVNLPWDRAALRRQGIGADTTIKLRLSNVSFRSAPAPHLRAGELDVRHYR